MVSLKESSGSPSQDREKQKRKECAAWISFFGILIVLFALSRYYELFLMAAEVEAHRV